MADRNDDKLLDHSYDGIQEYDNPMPRWWVITFWATIIFSVLYLLNVPGFGNGKGRIADYEASIARAEALRAKSEPPGGAPTADALAARIDAFLASRGYGIPSSDSPRSVEEIHPETPAEFVCEEDVRAAIRAGRKVLIGEKTILTPSARDLGETQKVFVHAGWPR